MHRSDNTVAHDAKCYRAAFIAALPRVVTSRNNLSSIYGSSISVQGARQLIYGREDSPGLKRAFSQLIRSTIGTRSDRT